MAFVYSKRGYQIKNALTLVTTMNDRLSRIAKKYVKAVSVTDIAKEKIKTLQSTGPHELCSSNPSTEEHDAPSSKNRKLRSLVHFLIPISYMVLVFVLL